LTTTGTKRVLVVRVVNDVRNQKPRQSEARMYDDVFEDDNNLVSNAAPMINHISIAIQHILL
jgi:hypothetical protein